MNAMSSSRSGFAASIAIVATLVLNNSHCFAADSAARFDLPAESLDKALRDFALQTHCQISYEPALVAGINAPAIRGDYTPSVVLAMLLKNTKLRAVNVNDDMIQVVAVSAATTRALPADEENARAAGVQVVRVAYANPQADATSTTDGMPATDAQSAAKASHGKNASDKSDELSEVVVTGTHIRGATVASPVIDIDREQIERSGYTSISDVMLSLPENFGGGYNAASMLPNNEINSLYTGNPAAASVPNLRGLGPGSTLTLIDGHRMASSLTEGGADISSIPIDAIDHIEVVTDSASAAYGSDAVAGVVNVILKRDYDGAKTTLGYGQGTEGGGEEKRVSQLLGKSWNSGNVTVAYEHMQQDAVYASERDFTLSGLQPDSLLPDTKSNAVTLLATQDFAKSASLFIDGLYVDRDAGQIINYPGLPAPLGYAGTLSKYAIAAGVNLGLAGDWKSQIFSALGKDDAKQDIDFLTSPMPTFIESTETSGSMKNVEVTANGTVATLPSGKMSLAVGTGYRRESFSTSAIGASSSFNVDRNIEYAFGEVSVPLVEHTPRLGLNYLDLDLSGRYERYSAFGSKTVPKFGIAYGPTNSLKFRSTWGEAFRAPNLNDMYQTPQLAIESLSNPASLTGLSNVIFRTGGNPDLKPETAQAWTLGFDYSPTSLGGMQVSSTLFDIKYTNRITSIENPYLALTDPSSAYFLTRSPSSSAVQSLYSSYPSSEIFNYSGSPYDPSNIAAILDTRLVNVASQTARGADLMLSYKFGIDPVSTTVFLNGTYLDLTQQTSPQSSQETLSGLSFYPPKWRLRSGATWKVNSLAITGIVNYLAGETNNQVTPFQQVASWTTVDVSLRYVVPLAGALSGLAINLSTTNVFNRNPPFVFQPFDVSQGLNYDTSNTSPLGRFIRLQVSKEW